LAGYFDSARGRRRSFQDNLNLVPFVDLFSTMIIFLISVAVWDQLASVKANMGVEDRPSTQLAPPDTKRVTSNVRIHLAKEYIEIVDGASKRRLSKVDENFDWAALGTFSTELRARLSDKKDMLIEVDDDVPYEAVIMAMDQFLARDFRELIVIGRDARF
jgi:biopolymer transport protein ExbD